MEHESLKDKNDSEKRFLQVEFNTMKRRIHFLETFLKELNILILELIRDYPNNELESIEEYERNIRIHAYQEKVFDIFKNLNKRLLTYKE